MTNNTKSSTSTPAETFLTKNFELIIYICVGIIGILFVVLLIIIILLIWRSKKNEKKKISTIDKKSKPKSATKNEAQKMVLKNESESCQVSTNIFLPTKIIATVKKDEEQEIKDAPIETKPGPEEIAKEKPKRRKKPSNDRPPTTTTTTTNTIELAPVIDGPEMKYSNAIPIWKYFEKEWERMKEEDPVDVTQKSCSLETKDITDNQTTTKTMEEKDKMAAIFEEMKIYYGAPVNQKSDAEENSLFKASISSAITKAETLSKTAEITAELQNCKIDSATGLLVVSKEGRKWLHSTLTLPYFRLWTFANEYKYLFTFYENDKELMKEKLERMSIPILYCYILNQSIPKSIKIAALEILREKLKCLIQTTPKEILMKFPHPIPAMYEIYAQNPTILYDDEWKKFDENSKK